MDTSGKDAFFNFGIIYEHFSYFIQKYLWFGSFR